MIIIQEHCKYSEQSVEAIPAFSFSSVLGVINQNHDRQGGVSLCKSKPAIGERYLQKSANLGSNEMYYQVWIVGVIKEHF